jgi:YfiH family protein
MTDFSKHGELIVGANGVQWFAAPQLRTQNWLWHGFSTRRGGVSAAYSARGAATELNLGFTAADDAESVRENRLRFAEAVTGSRETPLITARQVHSNVSVVANDSGLAGCEADGLMTSQTGVQLGILTADCIPVLVADPVKRAVAAFHAGWRGTVQRIVEHGIAQMRTEFGSDPADLVAAIGPGIGQCCYIVGGEVRERFGAEFSYADELFSRADDESSSEMRLDLIAANRRQLLYAGLNPEAVAVVGGCTACQPDLFYSHRASGGRAGRMMAVIGVRRDA